MITLFICQNLYLYKDNYKQLINLLIHQAFDMIRFVFEDLSTLNMAI